MKNNNNRGGSGLGIIGVLEIVFIVLKLTNLINWSWPIVLIPLWIDLAMVIVFIIILIISSKIDSGYNKHRRM